MLSVDSQCAGIRTGVSIEFAECPPLGVVLLAVVALVRVDAQVMQFD